MASSQELDLKDLFPLVATGKVRELYVLDEKTLLFVASDRVSCYDIVLRTPIPNKGRVLTLLSDHWFSVLSAAVPGLKHHYISRELPAKIPSARASSFQNRCMQVRRLRVLPIEAIVRGYITGSAWKEYQRRGTVHGMPMPTGLRESDAFPQGPIYTPSTKAEQGEHDENITPEKAAEIIGQEVAQKVAELAVKLYTVARDAARERGIIIADTKFEFGVDDSDGSVVLIDEVLTPDSSRFWPGDKYEIGRSQDSFDKQYLRDWLTNEGLQGKDDVDVPEQVIKVTSDKYMEAYEKLTGKKFTVS